MQQELSPLDASNIPQLEEAAEEVRATQHPRLVTRRGDSLALLVPIPLQRKQRAARGRSENSLLRLMEIANATEVDEGVPADVSENKYKYLADAYVGDVADSTCP